MQRKNLKLKFGFVMCAVILAIILISVIATKVYGTEPEVVEGQTLLKFQDENLYNAIIEELKSLEYEIDTCNGYGSYTTNMGYIIIQTDDLLHVTKLNLNNCKITELEGISAFTSLQELYLDNNNISDLTPIEDMDMIEVLNINENKLDNGNISIISTLDSLKYLGIGDNGLTKLGSITKLRSLKEINLNNEKASNLVETTDSNEETEETTETFDITGISNLENLETLHLRANNITDISELNTLTNMVVLDISNNNITDITSLTNMINLQELKADGNNITNITALGGKNYLTNLNLGANKIDDSEIEKLEGLDSLLILSLENNNITSIDKISQMTNLQSLNIRKNEIADISKISQLTNVKDLTLSDIGLNSLENISGMTQLEVLNISNNKLTNVDTVLNLTNLTALDVSGNKLSKINEEFFVTEGEDRSTKTLNKLVSSKFGNQVVEVSIEGLEGENKTIELPEIFAQAKEWAKVKETNYVESSYENDFMTLTNCSFNSDKTAIIVDSHIAATKDSSITIGVEDFEGTSVVAKSTSVQYRVDTTEEQLPELERNINGTIEDFNIQILEEYVNEKENKSELLTQDSENYEKIMYMDFNNDGNVNTDDYLLLLNYKNGNNSYLFIKEIKPTEITNKKVIAKIVTNDENVEELSGSTCEFSENGEKTLSFNSNNSLKILTASVNFMDTDAPVTNVTYSTEEETEGSVTVTITANEKLTNIYKIQENQAEGIMAVNTGWTLSSDERTITKEFTTNTEEDVTLQDKAGNKSVIHVNINNIK